jgi:hypothetical protein
MENIQMKSFKINKDIALRRILSMSVILLSLLIYLPGQAQENAKPLTAKERFKLRAMPVYAISLTWPGQEIQLKSAKG